MERDSFVFYKSFYDAIRDLPRDIQGEVFTAIMEYGLYGITTENLKPVAFSILTLIKPQLDKNNQRFLNGKKGAEHGKKGGDNKQKNRELNPKLTPNLPQTYPKPTPNDNVLSLSTNVANNNITSKKISTEVDTKKIEEASERLSKIEKVRGTVLSEHFMKSRATLCKNAKVDNTQFEHYASMVFDDWTLRVYDGKTFDIDLTHFRNQFPMSVKANKPNADGEKKHPKNWKRDLMQSTLDECNQL